MHLIILAGRANELSEVVIPCIRAAACVGTAEVRLRLLDDLCVPERMGPYCDVCKPNYYKTDAGDWCVDAASRYASIAVLRLLRH